jgi:hypothetical protein
MRFEKTKSQQAERRAEEVMTFLSLLKKKILDYIELTLKLVIDKFFLLIQS